MPSKLKVGVLFGGKSPEHEVSIISGREVVKNLNKNKYTPVPIFISKDGKSWQINGEKESLNSPTRVESLKKIIDIAFIAMHGPYGEDGTVQGFLELVGVPYTGSGVLASALGMDKISSRKLFTQQGLKVPKYTIVKEGENTDKIFRTLKLPIFVKPSNLGSSIGVSLVRRKANLKKALKLAFSFSHLALVEEYLEGTEVTGAVLGNEKPLTLPLVEIIPRHEFFDYQTKYNASLADEIVPARISKVLTARAKKAVITAYQVLGCRGFARVDMIIKGRNVHVLEVNTIPGLTPLSLFPKAALASGISYEKLLDQIIAFALEK